MVGRVPWELLVWGELMAELLLFEEDPAAEEVAEELDDVFAELMVCAEAEEAELEVVTELAEVELVEVVLVDEEEGGEGSWPGGYCAVSSLGPLMSRADTNLMLPCVKS